MLLNENPLLGLGFGFAIHKTGVKISAPLDLREEEDEVTPPQGFPRTSSACSVPPASRPLQHLWKPLTLHLVPNPLIRLPVALPSKKHPGCRDTSYLFPELFPSGEKLAAGEEASRLCSLSQEIPE